MEASLKEAVNEAMEIYREDNPLDERVTTNINLIKFINNYLKKVRNRLLNEGEMSKKEIEAIKKKDIINRDVRDLEELDTNNTSQFMVLEKLDADKITSILHHMKIKGLFDEDKVPEYLSKNIISYIDDTDSNDDNKELETYIKNLCNYFILWLRDPKRRKQEKRRIEKEKRIEKEERIDPRLAMEFKDGINKIKLRSRTKAKDGCWPKYERVPNTIQYSPGSCRLRKSPK